MKRITIVALCFGLVACSTTGSSTNPLNGFLAGLANKATLDLQTAVKTAGVQVTDTTGTHAVDPAGVTCGNTLIAVQTNVNAVLAAANQPGAGAVTAAEIGSLMLPGTPQTNAIRDMVVQGCALKVAQITNAVAGGAVWFGALSQAFQIVAPLAAAVP